MRKLKELLRLHFDAQLTTRQIASSLSLSVGVVNKYLKKASACSLSWPLPPDMGEERLQALLQGSQQAQKPSLAKDEIDFAKVHLELKSKGVTLQLLWEEYCDEKSNPLSYSRYCFHYRRYKAKLKCSMRQTHKAGDKAFIDYSGKTMDIIDPETGDIRSAEIFVGVLGASGYTFAQATWSQQLPDFLSAQRGMFEFFGGVPALIVPDNLKSAITKTCRYDPDVNQTYAQFIEHYGTAVLPARPYRPKDKPKAESGVQLVQRWILARLRHDTFLGLAELNAAIRHLLKDLNQRAFQKLEGSRESLFLKLDKPALKPLPGSAYEYREYKAVRSGIDYHVALEGHHYSVPHAYHGEVIDLWFNQHTVECYYKGEKIAVHLRSRLKNGHTTIFHHMPKGHQKHSIQSKERFINWSKDVGTYTEAITQKILESKPHPEQAYRVCLGLLRLGKKYTNNRLEKACRYGFETGLCDYRSILSVLTKNLDIAHTFEDSETIPLEHENIRGSDYYT